MATDKNGTIIKVPRQGDIVLYVDPGMGDTSPAIVTTALHENRVYLTVFQPGTAPFPVRNVVLYDGDKAKGTWHWRA